MILDVEIGGEKKGNKISDLKNLWNQIPTLTLGNLLLYIATSENGLSDVRRLCTITDFQMLV